VRILAVDYGERRTGLAVSDELGITAQGLETLVVDDETTLPSLVAGIAGDFHVDKVVVGLPLNMNGTESEKSKKVREFTRALEQEVAVQIVLWDERMTTKQAQQVMRELNKKPSENKTDVDRISATLMLQEFMKTQS
jgi:putative holliday junction resolvase